MVKEPLITLAPVNEPIGLSTTPIVSGVTYVTLFAIVREPPVILISYSLLSKPFEDEPPPCASASRYKLESLFLK